MPKESEKVSFTKNRSYKKKTEKDRKIMQLEEKLLKDALDEIPTYKKNDIIEHINWHRKYVKLCRQKKEHVQKWRDLKERVRLEELANDRKEQEKAKR